MTDDAFIHQMIRETITALRDLDAACCQQEVAATRLALAGRDSRQAETILAGMMEAMKALKLRLVMLRVGANSQDSPTRH